MTRIDTVRRFGVTLAALAQQFHSLPHKNVIVLYGKLCLILCDACLRTSADSSDDDATELTPATTLYREQVRRKWEEEARRDMTDPDGPLHYANVQFDGTR